MKKIVAAILTFVLTLTVLISGASGYSDCAVKCMRAMAKAHPHATTGQIPGKSGHGPKIPRRKIIFELAGLGWAT